jgi:hypothetical protein
LVLKETGEDMRIATCGLLFALCAAGAVFARDTVVGTYTGSYEVHGATKSRFGVTLAIASVEGGKVKGTATLHDGPCQGSYPVEGFVKDKGIGVRAIQKSGAAGDCGFGFKGTIDGNRLVGNMGKFEVELRK